ncbi:ABC transporter permease [Arthrobacter sp. Sa2CUA1]|uniref:ABC transporter permease n=1 Tax=Arthrobacter gallicola TaxID=2762225 RepID=A0ABR8USL5_9MICC|nr:ABC transporter permease [Arthrobacter gallicola]MBD7995539.1 ABC transporter permease [Arthrobacter gallicola]
MLAFLLRRAVTGVLTLLAICAVGFFLLYLSAGDTARNLVGQTAAQEIVDRKSAELGLDRSLVVQFGDWAAGAVRGDLGRSWYSGQPVAEALLTRLPVTLSLTIGAVLLSAVVAVALGAVAARRRGAVDRALQITSVTAAAVPSFLVALVLVVTFAISLRWVPATGYIRPGDSVVGWLSTIILPVIALSLGAIAAISQQIRGAMIDALRLDYVRTLRARGLPYSRVINRHVLRNAAGPALSTLGLQFVVIFGSAVVVEQVFAIPGLGQTAVAATGQGDVPLVMGVVIVTAIVVVLVNFAVDLLQAWLNPKVRLS